MGLNNGFSNEAWIAKFDIGIAEHGPSNLWTYLHIHLQTRFDWAPKKINDFHFRWCDYMNLVELSRYSLRRLSFALLKNFWSNQARTKTNSRRWTNDCCGGSVRQSKGRKIFPYCIAHVALPVWKFSKPRSRSSWLLVMSSSRYLSDRSWHILVSYSNRRCVWPCQ